jgi:hypothetical protein
MKHQLILTISIITMITGIYASEDTTYSDTRIVPVQNQSTSEPSKNENFIRNHKNSSDISNNQPDNRGFLESCICSGDSIESLKELGIRILLFPLKVTFCATVYGIGVGFYESNKYLFTGEKTIDSFYQKQMRLGISSGIGMLYLPKITAGLQGSLDFDFYLPLFRRLHFRERIGVSGSVMNVFSYFERDVFVNDQLIGIQRDQIHDYKNRQFNLSSECLITPYDKNGSFFIAFGGGPLFQIEKEKIIRTNSYSLTDTVFSDYYRNWAPCISFSIGRMATLNNVFGAYEIRYEGIIYQEKHKTSIPSDNANMAHSLQFNWSLVF